MDPVEGFESAGVQGGPFDPLEMVYTLTNTGTGVAQFTAESEAGWLTVAPASGSIATGGTVEVTLGLSEAAGNLDVGRHQSTLLVTNTEYGAGTTSRPVVVNVVANLPRITGVVPNPFGSGAVPETEIRFTLGGPATAIGRIHDIRGGRVADLGSMAGVAGENHFTWDGTDHLGRSAPSGKYVFILYALGREERTNIVLVR